MEIHESLHWRVSDKPHVVPDVSFVADPVFRVHRPQDAGFFPAVVVVAAPVDRVGNPGELSVSCAGNLDVHSGGLVLS